MAEINSRLQLIASLVKGAKLVVDVGSDHGKLPGFLLTEDLVERVIATDISAHSIQKINVLSQRLSLEDRLIARQGDGLSPIGGDETGYTLVIAGLGGEVIANLLRRDMNKAKQAEKMVIQPMSDAAYLRKFLTESGFAIAQDCLVKDAGRIYEIMVAKPGEPEASLLQGWPEGFYELSPKPLEQGDPLFFELLERKLRIYQKAYEGGKTKELYDILQGLTTVKELCEAMRQD